MKRYDPIQPPAPEEWLSMDEQERIQLAEDHHRRARIRLPNAKAHAVVHVMVENQIALGDEIPARRTLQRLMSEGLDRHEAIHAVGSVLLGYMHELLTQPGPESTADPNPAYFGALERLTAEEWRRSG